MRKRQLIFQALSLVLLAGPLAMPAEAETLAPGGAGSSLTLFPRPMPSIATDRLEMRSYQPYSGLQFGFRPTPPVQRGVRSSLPRIVKPKPVAPLIADGASSSYSKRFYAYCADRPSGTMNPVTSPYDLPPVESRQCP